MDKSIPFLDFLNQNYDLDITQIPLFVKFGLIFSTFYKMNNLQLPIQ